MFAEIATDDDEGLSQAISGSPESEKDKAEEKK